MRALFGAANPTPLPEGVQTVMRDFGGRLALAILMVLAGSGCSEDPKETAVIETELLLGVGSDAESFDTCAPITVHRLSQYRVALSGTLEEIRGPDGREWVFDVDRWYAGGDADVVMIRGSDVSIHYFRTTVGGGHKGQRFLIAGSRGAAAACLTRPWSQQLAAKYEAAFRG